MTYCGVPEDIDLRQLHALLRHKSLARPMIGEPLAYLKAQWRAGLHRLRGQLGLPQRSVWAALVGERFLLACCLLVVLCLIAIRTAPVAMEQEGGGAQP